MEGDGKMYGKRKILIWLIMITIVAMLPILSADASGSEKTLTFRKLWTEREILTGGGASSLAA